MTGYKGLEINTLETRTSRLRAKRGEPEVTCGRFLLCGFCEACLGGVNIGAHHADLVVLLRQVMQNDVTHGDHA